MVKTQTTVSIYKPGPEALAAWYPSTLPFWTHKDTSVYARERDRSLEERRPRRLTAAVMRLHSRHSSQYLQCNYQKPSQYIFTALLSWAAICERFVKDSILRSTESLLDPMLFAYRPKRGVDDATGSLLFSFSFFIQNIHKHAHYIMKYLIFWFWNMCK